MPNVMTEDEIRSVIRSVLSDPACASPLFSSAKSRSMLKAGQEALKKLEDLWKPDLESAELPEETARGPQG